MMKVLVLAEHDNENLKVATQHAVSAAQKLSAEIDILIVGNNCQKAAQQASLLEGVQHILVADAEVYAHQLAENAASLLAEIAKTYAYVLAAATTFSKNILPRAAALLDVAMLSDVTKIISADTFVRPMYAGNVLATVQAQDQIKVLTIRMTAFPPAQKKQQANAVLQPISTVIPNSHSSFLHQALTESKRPELTSARVVISGGRGLKSAENFQLLESIADRLGAAIGASRAAVDAGFVPNDYQVGQTGKVVAPDLYIAVGISGAIQHLAGMKDSKLIVAINNDPEAPIFQIADYGLVGDLFKILPELGAELDKVL